MKIKLTTNKISTTDFIKRVFFLLYRAAGPEYGMGIYRRKVNATEDDVWQNVCTAGDYPFETSKERAEQRANSGEFYADYCFGRMLKFGCDIKNDVIELRVNDEKGKYNSGFQGFANKYPTPLAIVVAVMDSFGLGTDAYEKRE